MNGRMLIRGAKRLTRFPGWLRINSGRKSGVWMTGTETAIWFVPVIHYMNDKECEGQCRQGCCPFFMWTEGDLAEKGKIDTAVFPVFLETGMCREINGCRMFNDGNTSVFQ